MSSIQPRRGRYHPVLREMLAETHLALSNFMVPLFIKAGNDIKNPIPGMPGHFQWSLNLLKDKILALEDSGLKSLLLFGIPHHKDATGSAADHDHGILEEALQAIKSWAPQMFVATDVCFCQYTDHGHCGILNQRQELDNSLSLERIASQALSHAQAGADMVAPSGMLDGAVGAIRATLDHHGFGHLPIMGYTVKYASSLYGPFRQATEGAPKFGDRRSHQADFRNGFEAIREAALDIQEGADILMVKPAHTYLDIIQRLTATFPEMPLAAYHTSGEYAMLQAAIGQGWIQPEAILEVLTAIKRAGARIIISYFAEEMPQLFKRSCL